MQLQEFICKRLCEKYFRLISSDFLFRSEGSSRTPTEGCVENSKKNELFDKPGSQYYGTWYRGISYWLFIIQKNPCFIFKAHVTQNNRLELRVSPQELVLKICTRSQDIKEKVPEFRLPNQTFIFLIFWT